MPAAVVRPFVRLVEKFEIPQASGKNVVVVEVLVLTSWTDQGASVSLLQ
jgi:hypothetical protein